MLTISALVREYRRTWAAILEDEVWWHRLRGHWVQRRRLFTVGSQVRFWRAYCQAALPLPDNPRSRQSGCAVSLFRDLYDFCRNRKMMGQLGVPAQWVIGVLLFGSFAVMVGLVIYGVATDPRMGCS